MLSELDQAIVFGLTTLRDDAAKIAAALVANEMTDREQDHLAKRLVVLADALNERAELTRKRTGGGSVSDISSARGDTGTKAV
ncbi:hypothetical protein ABUW04_17995 [Streptacidiphilus sp. N1-10]|uniref:Uncharacterized protein n=1 Tax=Streptacidiphilus jeojiensis TaxID=3229225 RepID=A0ABV6XPG1_9ACTN